MTKKHLVVVESPTKQKTISKILGSDYSIKSSYGHVRDLPEKELGIDELRNFKPKYIIIPKAKKNIAVLKESAKKCDVLFLATDHDREGESIAWHLSEIIKHPPEKVRRIIFNEITKSAVSNAIENAGKLDFDLIKAQQARRILDRLVGYKLSPLLWQKIAKGLSAGRVQSVAVRLLVERAKEIEQFKPSPYWSLTAKLKKPDTDDNFEARLVRYEGSPVEKTTVYELFAEKYTVKTTIFKSSEEIKQAEEFLKSGDLTVFETDKKTIRQRPRPPFITSTLQQEAYSKFGFSAHRTMQTAQSLYEGISLDGGEISGLITYMRTDSYNISEEIRKESQKFVREQYGIDFLPKNPKVYKTKVKGAQQAHEAIHPSNVYKTPQKIKRFLTTDQYKLYTLIWHRFIASQMADALFESVSADICAGDTKDCKTFLRATGRTLKFQGYLKIYSSCEEKKTPEAILPKLNKGDKLLLTGSEIKSHQTQPPPVYNEASLIKILESHGIGRPSTYAPIIKTIIDRKYADRQKGGKLVATSLGTSVTERLKNFFPDIMELSYTAEIEERLDKIADGILEWAKVVRDFYTPFKDHLATAYEKMKAPEPALTDEQCPLCRNKMFLRESRFGKYLSCSNFPRCKGKIPLDKDGNKLVLQKTQEKCPNCGKIMLIRTGRRGKFMACSGYPKCRTTKPLETKEGEGKYFTPVKTSRLCDKCRKPLVLRKSKKGYFLGCSGFPKCRNIVKVSDKEIDEIKSKK